VVYLSGRRLAGPPSGRPGLQWHHTL